MPPAGTGCLLDALGTLPPQICPRAHFIPRAVSSSCLLLVNHPPPPGALPPLWCARMPPGACLQQQRTPRRIVEHMSHCVFICMSMSVGCRTGGKAWSVLRSATAAKGLATMRSSHPDLDGLSACAQVHVRVCACVCAYHHVIHTHGGGHTRVHKKIKGASVSNP